jgi:hypothetical protein
MSVDTNVAAPFILVIETDKYAGNFERELCAYVTSAVGECGVGDEARKVCIKELGQEQAEELSELTMQISDDRGCYRPTSIWQATGAKARYESVAIFMEYRPSISQMDIIKERILSYPKYQMDNLSSYARDGKTQPLKIKAITIIKRVVKVVDKEEPLYFSCI